MKKTALVCVILLVAGLGFADPLEMTHREIHIDSQNPSRTDTYSNRSSDNMQLTDPIVGTAALNNWREKTTNTLVVDKNGRGDYTTIQGAIDSITDNAAGNPYVILICPGIYSETVTLSKSYIDLVGVSRDACIITRTFAQAGAARFGDGTLNWNANNRIQNLTVRNLGASPDAAIALYLGIGTKYIFNCTFYSNGRDTVTCGSGTNYFDDCKIYSQSAAHTIWIYNGNNEFRDCIIKSAGTPVQFTTVGYAKTGSFYNCSLDASGVGYVFDLVQGNNTLTVDNIFVQGTANLFYRTVGTINLGRVVGIDNNAATFTMLKNADSAFEAINVGTATGAAAGEIKTSGNISSSGQRITAKLFDVEHYTGGLPTASSTYRGCLAFVEAGSGSEDKLYVCVKKADGSYGWDEIGHGISE